IFKDSYSVYSNSSALFGGAVYCIQCSVTSESNIFSSLSGFDGGAIYIEFNSKFISKSDVFKDNIAIKYGGSIFITTMSYFSISNSLFLRNQATFDSAISIQTTSQIDPFSIQYC